MNEKSDPINDMILESGLDPDEYADVVQALGALRDVVPSEAPAPSPELAALLSGGTVTPLRRRHGVAVAAAVAAAAVALTSVAAAANVLPEPAQRLFSDFSHKYLPFEFPDPADRDESQRDAPLLPTGRTQAERVDKGNHLGGGMGAGKTGNLGKHKGQLKHPSKDPGRAENPNKPTAAGKATAPPPSKPTAPPRKNTDSGGHGVTATPKPDKPRPSAKPKAAPDSGENGSATTPIPGPGQGKGKGDADG